jgi:hypothetical protein
MENRRRSWQSEKLDQRLSDKEYNFGTTMHPARLCFVLLSHTCCDVDLLSWLPGSSALLVDLRCGLLRRHPFSAMPIRQ